MWHDLAQCLRYIIADGYIDPDEVEFIAFVNEIIAAIDEGRVQIIPPQGVTLMWYKKIGGLHWLALGRLRLALCWRAAQ